jgi:hypothetical protein
MSQALSSSQRKNLVTGAMRGKLVKIHRPPIVDFELSAADSSHSVCLDGVIHLSLKESFVPWVWAGDTGHMWMSIRLATSCAGK